GEELVTDMDAEAVEAFLAANGMAPSEVAVVGFHGQTVVHRLTAASPSSSATAKRWPADSAFPWSTTFALPTLPPEDTARRWCPYFIARCCACLNESTPWAYSISVVSPTSPSSTATPGSSPAIPAPAMH